MVRRSKLLIKLLTLATVLMMLNLIGLLYIFEFIDTFSQDKRFREVSKIVCFAFSFEFSSIILVVYFDKIKQ